MDSLKQFDKWYLSSSIHEVIDRGTALLIWKAGRKDGLETGVKVAEAHAKHEDASAESGAYCEAARSIATSLHIIIGAE